MALSIRRGWKRQSPFVWSMCHAFRIPCSTNSKLCHSFLILENYEHNVLFEMSTILPTGSPGGARDAYLVQQSAATAAPRRGLEMFPHP